jgi:hypothetical protein
MKFTQKHLNIISGLLMLLGGVVYALTASFNKSHPDDPNHYGKWIAIALIITGMFFLMPWIDKKK